MNKLTSKHIAWLLPSAYLFHLADEYFTEFPSWFSGVFNVNLSLKDFILINSIGFTITTIIALLYSFKKINIFIIVVFGILFFINGVVHIAASIITFTYSPGTVSAIIFYLPISYLVYKIIFPLIPEYQRGMSFIAGIIIQFIVAILALNI